MTPEELKRLASQLLASEWPGVIADHLAKQGCKSTVQRIEELEAALLLLSVGFLRLEGTVSKLVAMLERNR